MRIEKNISEISDEGLIQKLKAIKNGKIINTFIVGFTVGIYFYSTVKQGFGLFTFFPLAIAYLIVKNAKNNEILEKEIRKELKSRN